MTTKVSEPELEDYKQLSYCKAHALNYYASYNWYFKININIDIKIWFSVGHSENMNALSQD